MNNIEIWTNFKISKLLWISVWTFSKIFFLFNKSLSFMIIKNRIHIFAFFYILPNAKSRSEGRFVKVFIVEVRTLEVWLRNLERRLWQVSGIQWKIPQTPGPLAKGFPPRLFNIIRAKIQKHINILKKRLRQHLKIPF